jgi:peptidoglycan/LPS O-acetylase OafA/YrhL
MHSSSVPIGDGPAHEAANGTTSSLLEAAVSSLEAMISLYEPATSGDAAGQEPPASGDRDNVIEILRFIACCIVLNCHFVSAFLPRAVAGVTSSFMLPLARTGGEGLLQWPVFNLLTAGNFAVGLFFIMSGYVLTKPIFSKPRFDWSGFCGDLLKRYVRLAIPLYVFCLASYVLFKLGVYRDCGVVASNISGSAWLQGLLTRPHIDKDVVLMLLSPFEYGNQLVPPAWTIGIELIGSFVSYALAGIMFSSSAGVMIACVVALLVPGYLKLFVIGTLFAFCGLGGGAKRLKLPLILWCGIFLLCAYLGSYPWYLQPNEIGSLAPCYLVCMKLNSWLTRTGIAGGVTSLAAVLTFVAAKYAIRNDGWVRRIAWLGKYTYLTYLSHFLVVGSVASWTFVAALHVIHADYVVAILLSFASFVITEGLVCALLTDAVDIGSLKLARRIKQFYINSLRKGL